MYFDAPDRLETERLMIVPLTREAFEERRKTAGGDLADAMDELQERMSENPSRSFFWLTDRDILLKKNGERVGSIAYMSDPNYDEEHLIEIGYSVDEPYRNCGYATEALHAMTRAGQGCPCAVGMIAGVEIKNKPSEKVLKKCGYIRTDRNRYLGLEIWKYMFRKESENKTEP